jgi:hypothetical protein
MNYHLQFLPLALRLERASIKNPAGIDRASAATLRFRHHPEASS